MASKAGPAMWEYYNDFYQKPMLFANEHNDDYFESMDMLRNLRKDYELKMRLREFEEWQEDPGFGDDDEK